MEKTGNPLLEEIVGKMSKKNLFNSKSSISEEEDKMEENEAKQLEKEQSMKNNAIQENKMEKNEKQQRQIDEVGINEWEMGANFHFQSFSKFNFIPTKEN